MRPEQDPAIQRLLGAVVLGQGFQFHIVVCQSSHQVEQLLNTLADVVPQQRGGRVRYEHLAPYAALQHDHAWDDDALAQMVMTRLHAMPTPHASELLLVALDATPAKEQDAAAWRYLFWRMNEQRNALVAGLDAAFLLCLPPWMESVFAHDASDFWSIRGLSVTLALARAKIPDDPAQQSGRTASGHG